jgi:hypothetical protein
MRLAYAPANAKLVKLATRLGVKVYSFDMLSGVTCPAAKDCKSWAEEYGRGKRRIRDGKHTVFRCFSASQEALFTNVYRFRKANMEAALGLAAKSPMQCATALVNAIPADAGAIRIHVAGDFKILNYFDAWLEVCDRRPDLRFYAYTKMLSFWQKRRDVIPANLALTASRGGRFDHLIDSEGFRESVVVYSKAKARRLGLPIDSDDYHAYRLRGGSFALLIHGAQPAGSEAGKAVRALRGKGSYSRKKVTV